MRRVVTLASALALAALLTACASGGAMPDPTTPGTSPSASPTDRFQTTTPGPLTPSPAATPTGTPAEVPAAGWDAIVDDLAARGITATPELVSAENVTFSDGSLGCPQPGMSYTQAVVEGMRVIVAVDGSQYDYRFGHGDSPRLCDR